MQHIPTRAAARSHYSTGRRDCEHQTYCAFGRYTLVKINESSKGYSTCISSLRLWTEKNVESIMSITDYGIVDTVWDVSGAQVRKYATRAQNSVVDTRAAARSS